MPFSSNQQRRLFYAKAKRGEISQETLREWEDATPKDKKLPERVKTAAISMIMEKLADSLAPSIAIEHRARGTRTQRWTPDDDDEKLQTKLPKPKKRYDDPDLSRSRYEGPASEKTS